MPAKAKAPVGRKSNAGQRGRKVGDKPSVRGTTRAGLIVAPSRCTHMMKKMRLSGRFGAGGGVFMAGVLQYLMSEILELSGEICHERKMKRLSPRHMQLAIRSDEELNKMFAMTQISSGGQISNIHAELFPKSKDAAVHGKKE